MIGLGFGLGSAQAAVKRILLSFHFATLPGAATMPSGLDLTRASTEYVRDDSAGGYASGTVGNDVGSIANVNGVAGLVVEGPWTNLLSPRARGSQIGPPSPWNAGNSAPTFAYGPGVDGAAGEATRLVIASGGYPVAYGPFYQAGNYVGQTLTCGMHYQPTSSNQFAQLRWYDGSKLYAIASTTLPLGVWTRLERTATCSSTLFQFTPCDTTDQSANGGTTAHAADVLVDYAYALASPRGPIAWHDGTHAGTRLRVADAGSVVTDGAMELQLDVGLPYLPTQLRWKSRLFSLAGDSRTFVELDHTKRRLRASACGVEVVFPIELSWSPTDVIRFLVRIGNGKPTAKYAISTDQGATFGAWVDLGDVGTTQPPIVHENLPVDVGCDDTSSQLEGVYRDVTWWGSGSSAVPWTTIYCSPTGSGDGLTVGSPASLSTAISTARAYVLAGAAHVRIMLRGGTYFLQQLLGGPIDITPADANIIWQAFPGENPDFSGAVPIDPGDWTVYSGTTYQAPAPVGTPIRHVTVNGVRARTARTTLDKTGAGWTKTAPDTWTAPDSSIASFNSPTDARLITGNTVAGDAWKSFSMPIASAIANVVTILALAANTANFQVGYEAGSKIWAVENARELIAADGDFAHDSVNGVVYYRKRTTDTMATADARIPVLEELVRITGTSADAPVLGTQFLGVTFSDTNAVAATRDGWNPLQDAWQGAGTEFVSSTWSTLPAAVKVTWAQDFAFGGCTFTRLAGHGLSLSKGARQADVGGTRFYDISGDGLVGGGVFQADQRPADARDTTSQILIHSTTFDTCGVHWWSSCGLAIYFASYVTVSHCDFANLPYTALSINWGWGYAENGGYDNGQGHGARGWPTDQPPASGDTISGNHLISACKFTNCINLLTDGGCIYTVGKLTGTIIERCFTQSASYAGARGIYLDNSTSNVLVQLCVVPALGAWVQIFAPKATNNTFLNCWFVGTPFVPGVGGVDPTNVLTNVTWYTSGPPATWPSGAQAVIDEAGR